MVAERKTGQFAVIEGAETGGVSGREPSLEEFLFGHLVAGHAIKIKVSAKERGDEGDICSGQGADDSCHCCAVREVACPHGLEP